MQPSVPRYSRHMLLKVIGEEGQEKIENSRVLVAGLGALGSMAALLLARAGVGFLRIVDQDAPELHNLHRQFLYDEADVESGLSKAEAAELHLQAANSSVKIDAVNEAIGPENVDALCSDVDLVVDALDNIRTRYFINDLILSRGIPYVFGGAVETIGNIMTIIPGKTPCLRCLWPDPEAVDNHPRASAVGVLSSAAATVASLQVTEALKILVGRENDILSGLLVLDVWRSCFHVAPISIDPECICRKLRQ
ncbi:MAG: HesA/MoeB/ThiF family protein [Desulfomonile tiedjei]|uniref:HesA/MoeB/ThiF family protein n=1 Tax=Desulfomonile tiedjei TaxID=2358 RepID=A0A9D6V144_9BACT|nr:HesA/MoeB/ThiF family protein [Desulfomonile tiedjei]